MEKKHNLNLKISGTPINKAKKALILLHGRGSKAEEVLTVSNLFNIKDYALLAPQATFDMWYPYSFIYPTEVNEPWLSSALNIIKQTLEKVLSTGIKSKDIYFFGFSQGACLLLEFLARNAQKYGGAIAIIGGLIGDKLNLNNYKGDFEQTPILIATSNPDIHVPVDRVKISAKIIKDMNANVIEKIYDKKGHTIIQEHIDIANEFIFKS